MACLENIGEISFVKCSVLWTIPKFYDLPQESNTRIKSPRFHYEERNWQAEVYPNGYFCDSPPGWIGMRIINYDNVEIDTDIMTALIGFGNLKLGNEGIALAKSTVQGRYVKLFPTSFLKYFKSLMDYENLKILMTTRLDTCLDDDFIMTVKYENVAKFFENFPTATRAVEDTGVEKLTQDFKELLRNRNASDFVLAVENREFKAHKCVLAARSPVLMAMMQHETKEKLGNRMDITDFEPKTIEEFLNYLYTGRVENLNSENVASLYKAADKYQVKDLKKTCLNHMMKNVSIEGFCDVLALSLLHEEKDLQEVCTQFFLENSLDIVLTSKWRTFLTENPMIGNELFVQHLRSIKNIHENEWKKTDKLI